MGLSALLSTQILDSSATGRSVLTAANAASIRTVLGLELDVAKTWNNALTVFDGIAIDVTDTASDPNSNLLNLKIAGATKLRIDKNARIHGIAGAVTYLAQVDTATWALSSAGVGHTPRATLKPGSFQLPSDGWLSWAGGSNGNGTQDTFLHRDAANTLAQRNGANAQRFSLYGTYTDASNYRRLYSTMTTAGAATIGVEGLGTGATGNTLSFPNPVSVTNQADTNRFKIASVTDGDLVFGLALCNSSGFERAGFTMNPSLGVLTLGGTTGGGYHLNLMSNGLSVIQFSAGQAVFGNTSTIEQRSGTTSQTFRIYNTYTDASNYERARLGWESNQFVIGSEVLGTGTARTVAIVGGSAGTQGVIKAQTGGAFIGAQLNLSNSSNATASTSQVVLYTPAAGQLRITNATSDGFDRLFLGLDNASFPMLKRNGTAINFRLGNDSAGAPITAASLEVSDEVYGGSWNGSLQVPTKNALWDKIETISGGGGGGGVSEAFVIAMAVAL
jgi:hypothetical protein